MGSDFLSRSLDTAKGKEAEARERRWILKTEESFLSWTVLAFVFFCRPTHHLKRTHTPEPGVDLTVSGTSCWRAPGAVQSENICAVLPFFFNAPEPLVVFESISEKEPAVGERQVICIVGVLSYWILKIIPELFSWSAESSSVDLKNPKTRHAGSGS